MRVTTKLGLTVWDLGTDTFTRTQFAENWDLVDAALRVAKQVQIVATVPTTGNFAGRVVMLSADDGGFKAWDLLRYDGSSWAAIGGVEIMSSLPGTGNYAGRCVLLTTSSGAIPAYTLHLYNGSAWRPIDVISIYKNGNLVGSRQQLNFKAGTNVNLTVSDDPDLNAVNVQYDALVPASAVTIQKNGSTVGSKQQIEFITGSNVAITATDSASTDDVGVSIAAINSTPVSSPLMAFSYWNPIELHSYSTSGVMLRTAGHKPTRINPSFLNITFTAPSSGKVLVRLSATISMRTNVQSGPYAPDPFAYANGYCWALTQDEVLVPSSVITLVGHGVRSFASRFSSEMLIEGLLPGQNITWDWAHGLLNSNTGSEGYIFIGGRGDVEGAVAGPAILEAWSV